MKEASGEFSMTVIVIIAAIIIVGILWMILPNMGNFINTKWQDMVNNSNNYKGSTSIQTILLP